MAKTWTCLECGKDFGVGAWLCADGISNHRVEPKEYRCLDAPADSGAGGEELKNSRTMVCNTPPPVKVIEGDEVRWVGEGSVEFVRGRFTTTDPVQQYWLDKRPAYNATEQQWQATFLSSNQKHELREMELNAREQRLENERNELLAQTQSKVKREAIAARG